MNNLLEHQFELIIHVGPGKTGSTAIQHWLNTNRELLLDNNIYYPKHSEDANSVSSGNVSVLFTRNKDGGLAWSAEKVKKLIDYAHSKSYRKVVLSSEAFSPRLSEIISHLPHAKVVFYLRSPLEYIESIYNQSIKRHLQTKKFVINDKHKIPILNKVEKIKKDNPEFTPIIRFYGKKFFHNGDIVHDFLQVVDCNLVITTNSRVLNLSYTLEALEFKRALNNIEDLSMHRQLDTFLQTYYSQVTNFSLMTKKQFNEYKYETLVALRQFCNCFELQPDEYLKHIRAIPHKTYAPQNISEEDCIKILSKIKECQPELFDSIAKKLLNSKGYDNSSLLLKLVKIVSEGPQFKSSYLARIKSFAFGFWRL